MTREEIARALAAIEQARANRVEVWIDIIEMDGSVSQRIYRGSFIAQPGSHVGEPSKRREP